MDGVFGPRNTAQTTMRPLDAHLSHLRHLSKYSAAKDLLRRRFRLTGRALNEHADLVCAHIDQGLSFHQASISVHPDIRPVLQYYCYLNLAVAVIAAYRPAKWQRYRAHGVKDRSQPLSRVSLSSSVVSTTVGAVTLFHDVVGSASVENTHFTLRDLCVSIPNLHAELETAFNTKPCILAVEGGIVGGQGSYRFSVSFNHAREHSPTRKMSRATLEKRLPILKHMFARAGDPYVYHSRDQFSSPLEASQFAQAKCAGLFNYGALSGLGIGGEYVWRYARDARMLSSLTAGMLLSFLLSSMSRYRAILLRKAFDSRYNLLFDVFVNEADGMMVPAFRNILYGEELVISGVPGLG